MHYGRSDNGCFLNYYAFGANAHVAEDVPMAKESAASEAEREYIVLN